MSSLPNPSRNGIGPAVHSTSMCSAPFQSLVFRVAHGYMNSCRGSNPHLSSPCVLLTAAISTLFMYSELSADAHVLSALLADTEAVDQSAQQKQMSCDSNRTKHALFALIFRVICEATLYKGPPTWRTSVRTGPSTICTTTGLVEVISPLGRNMYAPEA